ncbi:DUF4132 domain-containing protein [Cognatiyoonia sp. IB215446]|uniref:DUF4132 domain-containing protein n=1 Tax=Cognatiyoonia sp. IB215446 TaxID=3097355 RepID=UPI002A156A5F|nr:DUF4132 domain-containing protein [Cognatiyoonia sp. IB215446]MDX8350247.1 DUF4132 domain-containing protein [Cognatiyoonia sp. IB215446]
MIWNGPKFTYCFQLNHNFAKMYFHHKRARFERERLMIGKLFQGFLSNASSGTVANIITRDLKRLNNVEKGMGDQAIKYVLTGESATVLSTLSVKGGGDQIHVCGTRYQSFGDNDVHTKRPGLFLDNDPYELDLLARYAQALAACCKTLPGHAIGTTKSSPALRVLCSEAFQAAMQDVRRWPPQPRKKPIKGLSADRLIQVTKALNAKLEDLFELLFWETGPYERVKTELYRACVDVTPLIQQHSDAAFAGVARCTAPGRTAFLVHLAKHDMANAEPFLGHVLAQTSDSAKSVREAALAALKKVDATLIETHATEQLSSGKVITRAAMVDLLLSIDTDSARAALEAHAKIEKTARVKAAIENGLSVSQVAAQLEQDPDDTSGYSAIDGTRVAIPGSRPINYDEPAYRLTAVDKRGFVDAIKNENERIEQYNRENKGQKYFFKQHKLSPNLADLAADFLSMKNGLNQSRRYQITNFLDHRCRDHTKSIIAKMPLHQRMTLGFRATHSVAYWFSPWAAGTFSEVFQEYLGNPGADLRTVEELWIKTEQEVTIGGWRKNVTRPAQRGDMLRVLIPDEGHWGPEPSDVPTHALWPYVAENLNVLDEAFGSGANAVALSRVGAVSCIAALPKVPLRCLGPLLDIATGEKKAGKAEARKLLSDVPEVLDRLIALLDDSRQAIRAGSAEWIGQRGDTPAVPALKKRLKKEKSEVAKAAILTALQQLGEPLDDYVGPAALIREAEAGLKKAKFDKLDWMGLDALPAAKFKNGKAVPQDVLLWWLFLANKLKQPGGNALFEIFLDQLKPDSAEAFSQWVFDSWVTYDTTVPSDEEANAHAEKNADRRFREWKRWIEDYTRERAFADLRREIKSNYLNSGAATKGILGLASRTPATVAADRVRGYLRNHGSRTSQASSLLDVLANKGDPVSLQVVIAAATRLKQKGVQAYAGTLIQSVADRMNWTMNELGDRVIPTAGLDDDGALDLPCGLDEKLYCATLGEDLTFVLKNPDGKVIKSLPAGTDDHTKASKKQFSTSKKELKQVVSMQTGRLYEALCGARSWAVEDWQRDFRDHPVMRRLTERLVWQGLDADGEVLTAFRPTAEGEYIDSEDADVEPTTFAAVRIAHGAMMADADAKVWEAHLKDYEVKPLFIQFGRSLMRLEADQANKTLIEDRKGWVLETFQIRGVATKLGYERGAAEDGGWFYEYRKGFTGVGLTAVVSFTGNWLPEENRPAALISLGFEKDTSRMRQTVPLKDVPEVLLSECWNDFHAMAEKGSFDPKWEKTCQW